MEKCLDAKVTIKSMFDQITKITETYPTITTKRIKKCKKEIGKLLRASFREDNDSDTETDVDSNVSDCVSLNKSFSCKEFVLSGKF